MPEVFTVGHSNRTFEELRALLEEHGIEAVADVRRFPGSRKHPQFGAGALDEALAAHGIERHHFEALGGRRRAAEHSPNTGWRVAAFNAYADHMATPAFAAALDELDTIARRRRVALLCAEALPWRCHRRLLADALLVRGFRVIDILGPGQTREHTLTPFARLAGGRLTYPGGSLFPPAAGAPAED